MINAMNKYMTSLENVKESFDVIVATGDFILDMIKDDVVDPMDYEEAKRFARGNAVDFIISILNDTDYDTYKAIDDMIFSLRGRSYFADLEDALKAVLAFDVDTIDYALSAPDGIYARNLKIYAQLVAYMNK